MNICLNSMFQEKCYPIRGIITLMYETNVYTCPCEIKYRFNLNHYDDSEIEVYTYNIIEEKIRELKDNKILLRTNECPTQFKYYIEGCMSYDKHFYKIKIYNAIGFFKTNLSISFPLRKDEVVYFYPLIKTSDGGTHYFDMHIWEYEKDGSLKDINERNCGFAR